MNKAKPFFLWLFFIVIILGIGWLFFHVEKEHQLLFLTGIGAIFSASIAHYTIKSREIEARHFESKAKAYKKFFDLLFNMLSKKKEYTEKELSDEMFEIKKEILIWGSSEIIKKWIEYEKESKEASENNNPRKAIFSGDKIFKAIRADLGHDDSSLKELELIQMILKDSIEQIKAKDDNE